MIYKYINVHLYIYISEIPSETLNNQNEGQEGKIGSVWKIGTSGRGRIKKRG
jgi:hypothetical protein